MCGGTVLSPRSMSGCRGLSPRVRGNPGLRPDLLVSNRSIPACAGEPYEFIWPLVVETVYPRVCGGTCVPTARAGSVAGLSPRVRGNPHPYPKRIPPLGSIPACAGEPKPRIVEGRHRGVYPRVCGGTQTSHC